VTELTKEKKVNPDTFRRLSRYYSEREICEIVWLVASEHLYNMTNIGLNIHSDMFCDISRKKKEKALISARWTAGQSDDKSKTKLCPHEWFGTTSGSRLEQCGFGGLDWASQKHSVIVVDPPRQSARRLRDRTFGFRMEEIPRTTPALRLDSFCDL
jgi:hypothetical protein